MARFYVSFDNTNKTAPGQPGYNDNSDLAEGYRYKRLTLNGDPTALRNALITARDNLSNALYDNTNGLEVANRSGLSGVIIPGRSTTGTLNINRVEGGTTTFTSAYTNSNAIVNPTNYYTRPTQEIYTDSAGSVSLSDPGSFSDSLWVSASNALQDFLSNITGGGPKSSDYFIQYHTDTNFGSVLPYGSAVLYPTLEPDAQTTFSRRLYSFHHDPDLTWFAWDDFVPGYVRGPSGGWTAPGNPVGNPSSTNQFWYNQYIPVNVTWDITNVFYPSDRDCDLLIKIWAEATNPSSETRYYLVGNSGVTTASYRNVTQATGAAETNNAANITLSSTTIDIDSLTADPLGVSGTQITLTTSSSTTYEQFTAGSPIKISYDASNYIKVAKVSWNSVSKQLVVKVLEKVGSGSYSSWTINNLSPYLNGYYDLIIKKNVLPEPVATTTYKLVAQLLLRDPVLGIIGPPIRGNNGIVSLGEGLPNETAYQTSNNFIQILPTGTFP